MRAQQNVLLVLVAVATMTAAWAGGAFAQSKSYSPGGSTGIGTDKPPRDDGRYRGRDRSEPAPDGATTIPRDRRRLIEERIRDRASDGVPPSSRRPPQRATTRSPSGAPPAGERRLVPDEVLVEVSNNISPETLSGIETRHRLTRLETQTLQLTGSTLTRWRIPDRRSVAAVVRQLEADSAVVSAQPNYLYTLQQTKAANEGNPSQYELAKLHLPQAHELAKGANVLVAVVDSGVDASHPEIRGSIAGTFDAIAFLPGLNKHGTAIAGLIAAHDTLMGAAPGARILAVRVISGMGSGASWDIVKGLDWAAASGARIINMSFAGPSDPAALRTLNAAYAKGIILIAAAGNAGPKSPPLYPAAYPNVIAVTATDAKDRLFAPSNRGNYIAVAAPGAELLVATPGGFFEVSSGTSFSAAQVSGIVALMLERKPNQSPDQVRAILLSTARDLGPKGSDSQFGAGLVDAYGALMANEPAATTATPRPIELISTGVR